MKNANYAEHCMLDKKDIMIIDKVISRIMDNYPDADACRLELSIKTAVSCCIGKKISDAAIEEEMEEYRKKEEAEREAEAEAAKMEQVLEHKLDQEAEAFVNDIFRNDYEEEMEYGD